VTFGNSVIYRYLRYLSPAGSAGNVSEIEFYAGDKKLTGKGLGTPGSWDNGGNTFDKALDGDTATFFGGPDATGNHVGIEVD
jgi:hypothetical protein